MEKEDKLPPNNAAKPKKEGVTPAFRSFVQSIRAILIDPTTKKEELDKNIAPPSTSKKKKPPKT